MNAIHAAESRALSAHLARTDRFADLAEMSFTDLLSLEDDLSEGSQWSLLDDVRAELAERRDEGRAALERTFIQAILTRGTIPMVDGGKLGCWLASVYLTETLATAGGVALAVELMLQPVTRAAAILALAREYVEEQAEELFRAGWTQ
jgi:hypothetical protein